MTTTRTPTTRHAAGPARRTGREIATGLGAGLLLLAVVVGLPIALYTVAGIPWPHHTPSPGQLTHALTERDNGQVFLTALLVVAWAGWTVFTVSVAVEAAALIRGTAAVRLPGCATTQHAAATLLAAVAVLLISSPQLGARPVVHGSGALPPVRLAASQSSAPSQQRPAAGHDTTTASTARSVADAHPTYLVQRGDTLWSIAETHLGDPERWREIARLNYDRPQPEGQRLTDAHWIYPGWTLRLPKDATGVRATALPTATTPPSSNGKTASQPGSKVPPSRPSEPSPSHTAAPSTPQHTTPSRTPAATSPAVTLTSGSEIGAGFAAGVLTAMTAARLRRRRTYTPQRPAPATIVTGPPPPHSLRELLAARSPRDDDTAEVEMQATQTTTVEKQAVPEPPTGTVEAGTRHDTTVLIDLTAWPGLLVAGEHVDDVVRAWIGSLLAQYGPPGTEIVMSTATLGRLLPGAPTSGLAIRILRDDDAVLVHLEVEQLRRARLLADADVATIAELQHAHPEDPLPITVAVLDTVNPQRETRWKLLFASAERLGMTAVQVGTGTPDVDPCLAIGPEHDVATARPQRLLDTLIGTRLFRLAVADIQALLEPLAAARGDSEHRPERPQILDLRGAPTANRSAHAGQDVTVEAPTSSPVTWPTSGADARTRPIKVRVLGPITITAWGREIKVGLRDSARELLAWYLLHPEGAPAETAIEAIWPDAPPDRGPQRFWNALGSLRSRLKGPAGEHVDVLTKVGEVYVPNTEELSADLWHFQSALAEAARDENQARPALQRAVELYTDDFAGTAAYLWVEPVREELHRRALDAHVRLAEQHDEQGEAEAAVGILEHAIALDPVAEDLYRRLIRLLARSGRADGVDRLWAQLQNRLADIDAEPEPATSALVRRVRSPAGAITR